MIKTINSTGFYVSKFMFEVRVCVICVVQQNVKVSSYFTHKSKKNCYSKNALEIPERIHANCFSGFRTTNCTALHPWSLAEGHSDEGLHILYTSSYFL